MFIYKSKGQTMAFRFFIDALAHLIKKWEGEIVFDGIPLAMVSKEKLQFRYPACKRLVLQEVGRQVDNIFDGYPQALEHLAMACAFNEFLFKPVEGNEDEAHFHLIATPEEGIPELNEIYTTREGVKRAFELYLEPLQEEIIYKDYFTARLKDNSVIYIRKCLGCLLWEEEKMLRGEAKTHYHLIASWPGCLPEYNEVFPTEKSARAALKEYLCNFDEEEIDYKDDCLAILKSNLRVFVEECEGCELWEEMVGNESATI